MTLTIDLSALYAASLDPLTKGLPFDAPILSLGEVGRQGWNLLRGDLPLPVAVVREKIVADNAAWMDQFTRNNGMVIAPHGKTTMSPQLFGTQIAHGAWAITVATVQQLQICLRFGIKRVIIANQLVGNGAIDACFATLRDPEVELYCLVDSAEGLALLADGAARNAMPNGKALRLLVEIGFEGGRAGIRAPEDALALARRVAATPGLLLAGFECFEGLLPTTERVDELLDSVAALAGTADAEGLVPSNSPLIVTAGGTAFFDRVGERFNAARFSRPVLKVLRSGCYLTHDSIGYAAAFERIIERTALKLPPGRLMAALEVWAYVQSRPEAGRAILTMGKRDAGFDAGLPVALRWHRPGTTTKPQPVAEGHKLVALNDQHAHMELPADSPLQVGDMVGFGIGHPCTTFDKWQLLLQVDEDYSVTGALKTFF